MNVLQRQQDLREPRHDLILRKPVASLGFLQNTFSKIATHAVFHQYHQRLHAIYEKAVAICNNQRMVQCLQQANFLLGVLKLFLIQAT
jgi:hypothetical protein